VLEEAERQRAEAAARELLARQVSQPPAAAERPQRIEQLRVAARSPISEALRGELLHAVETLEAAATELAREAALERLFDAVRSAAASPAAASVSTVATLYLELPDASRQVARERSAEPLFD